MKKKNTSQSANIDLCDRYHRTKGDTSEGRWLTVLFCIIGIALSVAEFFLFLKYKHVYPLMISISLINVIYTYVELSHLFIRKYWFRYHRRLAVALTIVIYWAVLFLVIASVTYFAPAFSFSWYYAYLPFLLMPPIIVTIPLLIAFLVILGG